MARSGDGDARGIDINTGEPLAGQEVSGYARMDLDFAREPRIEGQMDLAGHDLYHRKFSWMANLLRGQVKGALSWLDVCQFEGGVNIVGAQLADHSFGPADADLRLRDRLGADLELWRDILKQAGRS